MDCTYSMDDWILECKDKIVKVVDDVKSKINKEINVGFLGFRDVCDKE